MYFFTYNTCSTNDPLKHSYPSAFPFCHCSKSFSGIMRWRRVAQSAFIEAKSYEIPSVCKVCWHVFGSSSAFCSCLQCYISEQISPKFSLSWFSEWSCPQKGQSHWNLQRRRAVPSIEIHQDAPDSFRGGWIYGRCSVGPRLVSFLCDRSCCHRSPNASARCGCQLLDFSI